jgi:hypothetical protein
MIDSIYRIVQEMLNKNGYGILSPDRFMLFAKHSQLKILGNYIDEYRSAKQKSSSYSTDEKLRDIEAIIEIFTAPATLTRNIGGAIRAYHQLPSNYMYWGNAWVNNVSIAKIDAKHKGHVLRDYFISPSTSNPICYIESNKLYVFPDSIGIIMDGTTPIAVDEVDMTYYRYPLDPRWTYVTVSGKAIFNQADPNYQDFELPYSSLNRLVVDILEQAGLHIRDVDVVSYATKEESKDYQKDNQR